MRNINVAVIAVILSVVVHAKCVGESEDVGFEQRKRFDSTLQTCLDNFDVHTDMIIRTQDSRRMGARYLNEAEVNGRDECQKLCCEAEGCDVYIYEQKVPGSCYLFHCGSPEDFKCKFTQHRNYTSAILTLNNHLNELENQIKLTKHEEELNNLRKMDSVSGTTIPPPTTSTKVPLEADVKINHSSRSQCSRYQFECRGNGECIAIYNACDGIPQCSDGSDEAPELDCPTITSTTRPKTVEQMTNPKKSVAEAPRKVVPAQDFRPQAKTQVQYKATAWQQSQPATGYANYGTAQGSEKLPDFVPGQQPKVDPQQQIAYQARIYGREGEALGQQYPLVGMQWQGYQLQRPDDGSRIFGQKGSGLIPEAPDSQVPGVYNSEISRADYLKYAAGMNGNGYYSGIGPVYYPNNMPPRQQQQQQPQQQQRVVDDMQRPAYSVYGNALSGLNPSDYYYEDPQTRAMVPVLHDPRMSKTAELLVPPKAMEKQKLEEKPKMTESVKKTLENVPMSPTTTKATVTTTAAATTTTTAKTITTTAATTVSGTTPVSTNPSPRKSETTKAPAHGDRESQGVAAELSMSESDIEGGNDRPSGAILSLTLGMCITAIMIVLVGCRLRVVRRRMRRSSKSPYSHDADFLVNGMYL